MRSLFRRGVVVLVIIGLLFVPVAAFADDGELQPPIGAHAVTHPSHSSGFWDLLLVWLEAVV